MFSQHPKYSEFFDIDVFCRDNVEILRELFEQARDICLTDSYLPEGSSQTEVDQTIAILVAAAAYAEEEKIKVPMHCAQDDMEGVEKLANGIYPLMTLFSMEDSELVNRKGDKFSLTPKGESLAKKVKLDLGKGEE